MIQLKGHTQFIRGIAFPSGSERIFSGSRNGTVHVWDYSGRRTHTINYNEIIGCLISGGPWVFIGLRNSIKAWNMETQLEYSLESGDECFGVVYSMATCDSLLFSGAQNGSILVWKGSDDKLEPIKLDATLKGHTAAVTCLTVGSKRLYSGSTDGSIRVWDIETLKCIHTLKGHNDVITSLICWSEFLLTSSLDKNIKVWATTKQGTLEVVYTLDLKLRVLSLCGIHDEEDNPVLMCSCSDTSVRLFDLPSFKERSRTYSNDEVWRIETKGGVVFTGDASGTISAWKFEESVPPSSCGVGARSAQHLAASPTACR